MIVSINLDVSYRREPLEPPPPHPPEGHTLIYLYTKRNIQLPVPPDVSLPTALLVLSSFCYHVLKLN